MTVRDETMPEGRWQFDGDVAEAFDDMLDRSIPQLDVMREAVARLIAPRLGPPEYGAILDLGCSRGSALASVLDESDTPTSRFAPMRHEHVGIEVSEPMRAAAVERFAGDERVQIVDADLRAGLRFPDGTFSAVLSVLTLQFVPIEHRLRLLAEVGRVLAPGGAFVLVEKVLGASAAIDTTMVDLYYRRKREQGYTDEQIERKRLALEGVLVPVTAHMNEELLRGAGFTQVDCVWRWMNFAGWVALR